jgi:hypothetical protein
MLYKPNFCCDCGEKIERESWMPWTSRRFCDDCGAHLEKLPRRALLSLGAALALFGGGLVAGQFVRERKPPLVLMSNQNAPTAEQKANMRPVIPQSNQVNSQIPAKSQIQIAPKPKTQSLPPATPPGASMSASDTSQAAYFCGARTQKGTPCSRRVRSAGRCWQHVGKPAMMPEEKLKISQ